MKKVRIYERGAAHVLAIAAFVFLLGAVGFVGYNAWQKQSTNAGSRPTLGATSTYDATNPATYRFGPNNLCRMYHTLHMKVEVVDKVKPRYEIKSNNEQILYVDTAKHKAGTKYFSSSSYVGSLENATVKYLVKTPSLRTDKVKAKNGKTKSVTKTVWNESASALLVRDLPRCVPTNDASEFNFRKGYTCVNNGEIVIGYKMVYDYTRKVGKATWTTLIDNKIVKSVNLTNKDVNQSYTFRVPAKGKVLKLLFSYGKTKKTTVNQKIANIKSCL